LFLLMTTGYLEQGPSYARHGRTLSESGPAKTQC